MRTSFSLFSFAQDDNLAELFTLVKKAGYDGVEPVLSNGGYLNASMSDHDILAIRTLAEKNDLVIPTVGAWNLWEFNLVSENEENRMRAQSIIRFQLKAARLLGADTILVIPGWVGTDFSPKPEFVR
jgi:hexulose-6-phosphate isomerase